MSCNLAPFSWFDVNVVKKRLFNEKFTVAVNDFRSIRTEDSDDNGSLSPTDSNSAWLQECYISLSPSREILVFSNTSTVVILTSKWESQTKNNLSSKYVLLWSGSLIQDKTEQITSVLCLPLESVGRSSHHGADWTCLIVGFSSGHVRFYTENGSLMVSELFHDEPVLSLKCHSYRPSTYPGEIEHHEELLITYHSAVVSLNGFALFQTLRGCRSHLARVKTNCRKAMKPPSLAYKKWGFIEQRLDVDELGVSDCEVIGPSTPHLFDHLHQHHLISSQFSSVGSFKPRGTASSMIVATAGHPFVGFHHYSTEDAGQQIMHHDAARAVTGSLRETLSNTVSSWFFRQQQTQEKVAEEKAAPEPAGPMNCRFDLCDPLRKGKNIVLNPNRKLSAVTDNLGRIILVDNFKGIAVRLWKGYRGAHCGWLEVFEEPVAQQGKLSLDGSRNRPEVSPESLRPLRMAHFLIVHIPRSSILQVLSVQKGSRIATIPVPKGSRLLYIKHGIVGTNNVMPKKKRSFVESTCVMIDPSGFLKEVTVPFHFALSEESSEKVRYLLIHRLKKALKNARGSRTCLKEMQMSEVNASEEIVSLIKEIRCNKSLMLVLITMSTHCHTTAPIFISAIKAILQRLENGVEKSKVAVLWNLCHKLLQLLNLYGEAVSSFEGRSRTRKRKSDPEAVSKLAEEENMEFLTKSLKLSELEVKDFLKLVQIFSPTHGAKVKAPAVAFEENVCLPLVDFLSCFDLTSREKDLIDVNKLEETESSQPPIILPVSLKPDLEEQNMQNLCHLLFYRCLDSKEFSNDWMSVITSSGIITKDLMSMAMHNWLSFGWHFIEDFSIEVLQRLITIIRAVCQVTDPEKEAVDGICIHSLPWWRDVRIQLAGCHSPFLALLGALTGRALALYETSCGSKCTVQVHDEDVDGHAKEEGWERVSVEGMAWDKLVHSLEDLAYLEAAVCWSTERSSTNTSLAMVTVNGRGCISEMVAQWVLYCSETLDPEHWSPSSLVSFLQSPLDDDDSSIEGKKESPAFEALDLLRVLRARFPFSISASTLIANVCWECARRITSQTTATVTILSSTFGWLEAIPSSRIRRGVCGLLWTVYLQQRIKAGAQLLECYRNIAAIPEKVVLDKIGLPSIFILLDLFVNAYKFLDIMIELADGEEEEEESLRWEEDLWKMDEKQRLQESTGSTPPPLIELAIFQPPSLHPYLLTLYHQLCLILCLMSRINYNDYYPVVFIHPMARFFPPVEQSVLLSASDSEIQERKEKFRNKIKVTRYRLSFFRNSISAVCRSQDYGGQSSVELIGLIYRAAEMFGLPMDIIRIHHVCELYSCGYDKEAEEQMTTVVDKEQVWSKLMLLGFQPFKHYLDLAGQRDHSSEVGASSSTQKVDIFSQADHLIFKNITEKGAAQLLGISIAFFHDGTMFSKSERYS